MCYLLAPGCAVKKALLKHSLVTVSTSAAQNKHHFLVEGGPFAKSASPAAAQASKAAAADRSLGRLGRIWSR